MFNLDKVKDQLTKYSNKLSIGILGSVAAIVPQAAESQDRQIEEVVVSATGRNTPYEGTIDSYMRVSMSNISQIFILVLDFFSLSLRNLWTSIYRRFYYVLIRFEETMSD